MAGREGNSRVFGVALWVAAVAVLAGIVAWAVERGSSSGTFFAVVGLGAMVVGPVLTISKSAGRQ